MDDGGLDSPHGRRLMVRIIDDRAAETPDRPWLMIPRTSNPADGWRSITYGEGANAINFIAHRIIELCGTPKEDEFPTIAYIGPNDIRYIIVMFGAIKASHKALFISPRNSYEGQMNLFDKTNCKTICYDADYEPTVQPWIKERGMKTMLPTPIDELLSKKDVPPFPYEKTYEQEKWHPFAVLHTSGSTGLPKPIICRQGMIAISDAYRDLPSWHGTVVWPRVWMERSKVVLLPMPLFHAAGLYLTITGSLYWDTVVALSVPSKPLTPDLVLEMVNALHPETVLVPPVLLEEISNSAEDTQVLSKLEIVAFSGGSLPEEVGDKLVDQGVTLCNIISSTEFAPFPIYWQPDPKLWPWFIINSDIFGCDWRPTDTPDVYEQVIVRKSDDPGLQGFFYTFPELQEFRTHDLYRRHPTLPDHWAYEGRSDDVLVFSNGEKLNPVTIERAVEAHPRVAAALVVGAGRFQPALLLEPHDDLDDAERERFVDEVWPTVEEVNKVTVAHGRIGRAFIAVAARGKPFPRAGKGTVLKARTTRLYETEIEELYEQAGKVETFESAGLDLSSEEAILRGLMKEIFAQDPAGGGMELGPDTDFFQAGVDSMKVIEVSKRLRATMEAEGISLDRDALATRAIYGNPTPRKLAHYLYSLTPPGKDETQGESAADREISAMHSLVDKYRELLPRASNKPPPADQEQTVILTGSTGGLGSHILDFLGRCSEVKTIVCLNRAENGLERQTKVSGERGLDTSFPKAKFLHADLSKPDLGLGQVAYRRLQYEADRVIHNQWPVNFNMGVESFEPHIRGVRHLVNFSAGATKKVLIAFISSISTVDGWKEEGPVPESPLDDFTTMSNGYGRSKFVSSLILDRAREAQCGVPSQIIRLGQVAGPEGEGGVWNKQEWLPTIIASSLHMGILPSDLGTMDVVDWTPVEGIAKMVLELSGISSRVPLDGVQGYFHGVNPQTVSWNVLAHAVAEFYEGRIKKLVPFGEWVSEVERTPGDDAGGNPAVKLLDTYSGMAAGGEGQGHVDMAMERTVRYSSTMKGMKAVTPELMKHWCSQWGY